MKKSILYLCFVIVVLGSFVFMSNTRINETSYTPITTEINNKILRSGGAPGGDTGSPGDGTDCTRCHGAGGNFSLDATITTTIPETGYELGVRYEITVDASSTSNRHGFELTAEKTGGTKVGAFDISDALTELRETTAVTHSNNTQSSWTFNWTAPAIDEGTITFYAAALAGDGGGSGGDETFTTNLSVNLSTLGISDENLLAFDIYPNPSQDYLTILLPNEIATGSIELFDYSGKSVKSTQINSVNNTLDMKNLSQGIYFIKLNSEGKIGVQKVIKK